MLSDWNGEATRGFGIPFEPFEMEDVATRSAFLVSGDTVAAAWLLGTELPDVDAIVAVARAM
jgi:hypothetical protein